MLELQRVFCSESPPIMSVATLIALKGAIPGQQPALKAPGVINHHCNGPKVWDVTTSQNISVYLANQNCYTA